MPASIAAQEKPNRFANLLTFGIAVALAIWMIWLLWAAVTLRWGVDMRFFWNAAKTLLAGGDPYVHLMQFPSYPLLPVGDQFHPLPWVALFFIPFGLLEFDAAIQIWAVINWLLILVSFGLVIRLVRGRLPNWGIALLMAPVLLMEIRCLQMSQVGVLILDGLLLGFLLRRGGHPFLAGLAFCAALFKPWIAAGCVLPLLAVDFSRREWKMPAGFAAGAAALLAVTTAVWPSWWVTYPQVDFAQSLGIRVDGVYVEYWPVSTLQDFLTHIVGLPQTGWWWAVSEGVLIIGSALFAWAVIAAYLKGIVGEWFLAGAGTVVCVLLAPYIRYADYPVLVVWWVGVAAEFASRRAVPARWKAIGLALLVLPAAVPIGPHLEPWMYLMPVSMALISIFCLWVILRRSMPPRTGEAKYTGLQTQP